MNLSGWSVVACALVGAFASSGANAQLRIEITRGVDRPVPMAIVPFSWQGPTGSVAPFDVSGLITADLGQSGRFDPIEQRDMVSRPTRPTDVDFDDWRIVEVDVLVIGGVAESGPGQYEIVFQLFDVLRGEQMLGFRLTSTENELRAAGHRIADMIFETLTGIPGVFNTRIAYVSQEGQGENSRYRLIVADADGANPNTVADSPEPLMSPSWSPDGKSLAYVSFENKRPEIFIQQLATARRSKVSSFKGLNGAPSWSPDGKFLALVLSKDGSPDIYTLNTTSKRLKRLTKHRSIDTEPVWSADGRTIIFTSDRSGGPQLYEVSVEGGKPKRITFEGRYNSAANVSPDGRYIAMVHGDRGRYKIAQLDRETGNLIVLTDASLDESPSFSPNGKMLLYASTLGNNGLLFAVSIDGRAKHKLSDQAGDIREPVWGPFESK